MLVLVCCGCTKAYAQCTDSVGMDDVPALTRCEAEVLSRLGGTWPNVEGDEPPVLSFRNGNSAVKVDKSYFFQKIVVPRLPNDQFIALNWYALTVAEKQATGVDAIVVAWSKIGLTERRKRKILRELGYSGKTT
mgnify:CR=1 FL=1